MRSRKLITASGLLYWARSLLSLFWP